MFIKLNKNGKVVGFNSRPGVGYIAVDRQLYTTLKTRYTSAMMSKPQKPSNVEISVDPEDLARSMMMVKPKNYELFLTVLGAADSIPPNHIIFSPLVDEAREGFVQIYMDKYTTDDPIGVALAWSSGRLYNPSKPFVMIEETEPQSNEPETATTAESTPTEPKPKRKARSKKATPKGGKKTRTSKTKDTNATSGESKSSTEPGTTEETQGVQELVEDPWSEQKENTEE